MVSSRMKKGIPLIAIIILSLMLGAAAGYFMIQQSLKITGKIITTAYLGIYYNEECRYIIEEIELPNLARSRTANEKIWLRNDGDITFTVTWENSSTAKDYVEVSATIESEEWQRDEGINLNPGEKTEVTLTFYALPTAPINSNYELQIVFTATNS